MKTALQKVFSNTMAVFLLLSTTSWKVEKHYCMGRLIDIAFFVEATDCGMGVDFLHGDQDLVVKSVCCDEEVDLIKGQDSYKSSFSDRNASVPLYFSANTTFEFTSPFVLGFKPCLQSVYPPPILVKDIQLFDQVFLI